MYALARRLFPICRSITGDGVRETLAILGELIPLEIREVPSGTRAYDWTVPREWNVRDAFISDATGSRVVDFRDHNLHLVGYSVPVRARLSRAELDQHLHSLPERPDVVPYRTTYYEEAWGFCLRDKDRRALPDGDYDVVVDTTLETGSLTYGELALEGERDEEVLISTHVCHPSLANDNVSGLVVATFLAMALSAQRRRYRYRFLFTPGTIGSLVWLSQNEHRLDRIKHGLVLACLGDPGRPTYKRTRRDTAEIDRVVERVLAERGTTPATRAFVPDGYDERQFASPGFDLPVGRLTRTPNGEYPEYHTSADDLELIRPYALADSLDLLLTIANVLEHNQAYRNLNPRGEPQLGRRGLYTSIGATGTTDSRRLALLWVLNLSDGTNTLLDIAVRSGLSFGEVVDAADALLSVDLLSALER